MPQAQKVVCSTVQDIRHEIPKFLEQTALFRQTTSNKRIHEIRRSEPARGENEQALYGKLVGVYVVA